MNKFNVGDKVRVIQSPLTSLIGEIFTVVAFWDSSLYNYFYDLEIDGAVFAESELELVGSPKIEIVVKDGIILDVKFLHTKEVEWSIVDGSDYND